DQWQMALARLRAARACVGAAMAERLFAKGGASDAADSILHAAASEGLGKSAFVREQMEEDERKRRGIPTSRSLDEWLEAMHAANKQARLGASYGGHAVIIDVVGNLHRPGSIDPACLRWHEGVVVKLAATIYDDPGWPDLSVGADPDWSTW